MFSRAICEARYRKLAFKCKVMVVVCVDIDASLSHIGFFDKLWIMQWWLLLLSFFLRVYFSQSATWARKRIVEPRVRVLKRHPIISIVWPNVLQCSLWKLPIQTSMPMTYNQLTMQELKLLRNRNKYVKFLCVHSADRQRSWKWAKKLFNYKKIRLWWVHFSYNSIFGVNPWKQLYRLMKRKSFFSIWSESINWHQIWPGDLVSLTKLRKVNGNLVSNPELVDSVSSGKCLIWTENPLENVDYFKESFLYHLQFPTFQRIHRRKNKENCLAWLQYYNFHLDWQVDTKVQNKVKCPWHNVPLNLDL